MAAPPTEEMSMPIHALFVGGTIDNSELDLDGTEPPHRYPPDTGGINATSLPSMVTSSHRANSPSAAIR